MLVERVQNNKKMYNNEDMKEMFNKVYNRNMMEMFNKKKYNRWKTGTPEEILDKDVLDIKENLEEIPKKKLVPRPMKKKKVIGSLPTVLEEDSGEEMNDDKDADEGKSSLSMPKGQRISKRTERRDYRGLC